MKKILIVLIIGIFIGCKKENQTAIKNNSLEKYYIISIEDKKIKEHLDSLKIPPPLIPTGVSVESNLIIDKNSNFFYYQRPPFFPTCGTGMQNDTIPKFIDLQTKEIVEIPEDCIEKFINQNVMAKEKRKQILIIASQNDTIKNKKYLDFLANLKVPTYIIRRTTQEEDTVLYYKKANKYYNSDKINWDKKRIKLKH